MRAVRLAGGALALGVAACARQGAEATAAPASTCGHVHDLGAPAAVCVRACMQAPHVGITRAYAERQRQRMHIAGCLGSAQRQAWVWVG